MRALSTLRMSHARRLRRRKLPGNELSESVHYEDGSPEAFLSRLWRELYGDETP